MRDGQSIKIVSYTNERRIKNFNRLKMAQNYENIIYILVLISKNKYQYLNHVYNIA